MSLQLKTRYLHNRNNFTLVRLLKELLRENNHDDAYVLAEQGLEENCNFSGYKQLLTFCKLRLFS